MTSTTRKWNKNKMHTKIDPSVGYIRTHLKRLCTKVNSLLVTLKTDTSILDIENV